MRFIFPVYFLFLVKIKPKNMSLCLQRAPYHLIIENRFFLTRKKFHFIFTGCQRVDKKTTKPLTLFIPTFIQRLFFLFPSTLWKFLSFFFGYFYMKSFCDYVNVIKIVSHSVSQSVRTRQVETFYLNYIQVRQSTTNHHSPVWPSLTIYIEFMMQTKEYGQI